MPGVVVPLDQSSIAEEAIAGAAHVARAASMPIRLLSVLASEDEYWELVDEDPNHPPSDWRESREAYLASVGTAPTLRGLRVSWELRDGDPAQEILASSAESDTALIVMTTRGRGGPEDRGVGSVVAKVIRHCFTPVLAIPPHAPMTAVERVVVGLDGSRQAEQILPSARWLAEAAGASIHLLRVVRLDSLHYPLLEGDVETALRSRAESYLRRVARPGEVQLVAIGRPARAIAAYAEEESCQVIALATHGRGGAIRFEMGSVAETVLQEARCPLLLVRIPAPVM